MRPHQPRDLAILRGVIRGFQPGLPVEVLVPPRKRMMLQYPLEPLGQALWSGERER
jgi:HlyD family secretion protein